MTNLEQPPDRPADGADSRNAVPTHAAASSHRGEPARATALLSHLNDRPSWNCATCGDPWPCATVQDRLLAEFRAFPSVLTVYLSAQMYDAIGDLISNGQMAPNNLFERFVAWARKATVVPEDAEEDDLVSAFREQ